jgi:uncharacterized cofD-like protein
MADKVKNMDNSLTNVKIVCLGGGVGTSNAIRGLKQYSPQITVITSMADDGGSSGRLRKAYRIMPPGDIVSCISAMIPDSNIDLAHLLTYRFPGNSKENKSIDGHKLGNLIMFAEILRTKDFYKAIEVTKKLFGVTGEFLPATDIRTRLSAITKDGRTIHSETTLDLAKYSQPHGLKKIYITPKNPRVNPKVINQLLQADIIISGPGDLYTNQLPVLIIPEIKKAIIESKAKKVFVVNITNKPFETKGYAVIDFIKAVKDHLQVFPFDTVLINDNQTHMIPKKYKYEYVPLISELNNYDVKIVQADLVSEVFPLYHDPVKLARAIKNLYNV